MSDLRRNEVRVEFWFEVNRGDSRGDVPFEQCPFFKMEDAVKYINQEGKNVVKIYQVTTTKSYTPLTLGLIYK